MNRPFSNPIFGYKYSKFFFPGHVQILINNRFFNGVFFRNPELNTPEFKKAFETDDTLFTLGMWMFSSVITIFGAFIIVPLLKPIVLWRYRFIKKILDSQVVVDGEVVSVKTLIKQNCKEIEYQYIYLGKRFNTSNKVVPWIEQLPQIGETVKIMLDPEKPQNALIKKLYEV